MKTKLSLFAVLLLGCPLVQGATQGSDDARDHLANTDSFITQKRSKLAIQSCSRDIFGLPQDPKKAREVDVQRKAPVAKQAPQIPFQQIVDTLPVTLMNSGSNLLMIEGAGPVRAGRTLEFIYQGTPVRLRLETVREDGAWFRDLKTRKLVCLSSNKLAKGIQRGNPAAPSQNGIQRINPNVDAPISIDLNALAEKTTR